MKNISFNSPSSLPVYTQTESQMGLANLQQHTKDALLSETNWGFSGSKLKVKRYKLDPDTWQLTVVNPKTKKTILQAEGHGDTIFANENNLARMAEMLMKHDLTIRTDFKD